ncbi:hypothetical protein THAOC_11988 [Thalassiosira oceanica]|uniref:Uncharacterized protein n=1 Tax=Thalassiosira oceanica TaxID=159749 RepID=K0SL16_THAOC|nr:hypothetical protein THAOC_11988 [Thalassiosira oceanica]|eukprot:EJK67028.1 hypothetical protein THAOC_11988 [Thalassiosira oceanica]
MPVLLSPTSYRPFYGSGLALRRTQLICATESNYARKEALLTPGSAPSTNDTVRLPCRYTLHDCAGTWLRGQNRTEDEAVRGQEEEEEAIKNPLLPDPTAERRRKFMPNPLDCQTNKSKSKSSSLTRQRCALNHYMPPLSYQTKRRVDTL